MIHANKPQALHPDFETNLPNTQYFFLGHGGMQGAIQWSEDPGCTPLGLLISDPAHFCRKWSTHLFHPEFGLERTQLTVIRKGVRYRPQREAVRVEWVSATEPVVRAVWSAGGVTVTETFRCPIGERMLVRDIEIANVQEESIDVEIALYASNALYNWFEIAQDRLDATGYEHLRIWTTEASEQNERFLTVSLRPVKQIAATSFYYEFAPKPEHPNTRRENALVKEQSYWLNASQVESTDKANADIARLFKSSAAGLRAAVSATGRFDASIWQYNFEWSGDASMVAEGLVYTGQFEVSRAILNNILTRLTNDQGMCMESSRFRGGRHAELNNNGEVLKANYTYWQWSGDDSLIHELYPRLRAIADYLLRPEYLDERTRMLKASRDIWERMESMGILPGYDVSHQVFGIRGLEAAANIASIVGDKAGAARWAEASANMRETFLNDPDFRFINQDRVIKRRLLDGSVQYDIRVDHAKADDDYFRKFCPPGMPLASEGHALWEPDVSEVFPICYGLIDGASTVGKNTMEVMEMLWSQEWEGGGYGRYNVLSEPDSPGPWPFATGYVAAAYLEMGDIAHAKRAIEWLSHRGRQAGSWFEFYGYRPTPPLPPTGIIVWGWAQFATLVVRHILKAKVEGETLTVSPRIPGFTGQLRFRDTHVQF